LNIAEPNGKSNRTADAIVCLGDFMAVYAAVDIGSNSCRLKIARVQNHKLHTLHEDREVTRLGESVFQTGVLSPESMADTIRALKRFHRAVQSLAVDKLRVVATSAMRDARNATAFTTWVRSATGWNVDVISGLEEGRLIHAGVVSNEPRAQAQALLIDLGGGSCEITYSDHRRIKAMLSLPLGAVRLTQDFLQHDPPTGEEVARMRQFISRELRKAQRRLQGMKVRNVIATSGTAAALVDASAAFNKQKNALKDFAAARPLRKLTDKLTRLDNAKRADVPGIGPKRSEIVIAGAHVYSDIVEKLALEGFRYSPMGLRDGILAEMLAQQDTAIRAHQMLEAERWEGVMQLCRRYGVDLRSNEAVCNHATQLFRELQKVHGLPPEYEFWLVCAAMLHDVGKFVNYQGWHRHTHYVISTAELYGFTPEERTLVSAIARYLGKSRPSPEDRVMRTIAPQDYANVQKAVVLLRLALALNQDRASDVLRVKSRILPRKVTLQITPGRTGAALELWALRREAAYFREVFRRELLPALE
jgi:exopolyphosphatase/guanosine-5'-triphosphate,3'-diphosphate pyrophosphatase